MSTENPNEVVDPKNVSVRPIALRYGLIGAMILIVLGLVYHISGLTDYTQSGGAANWITSIVNWAVMIGAIALGIRKHRDEDLGGFITFGRSFGLGALTSLVIAVVTAIWTYIFFAMIEPDLLNTILEATRDRMAEQQNMDDDQIDQAMGMMSWMFNPGMFSAWAGLITLIAGLIFSLIVSAIMKKNPPSMV